MNEKDGKSFESAYVVINLLEEYAVLERLRLTVVKQALLLSNGRHYDKFITKDPNGTKTTLYFDVEYMFRD